MDLSLFVNGTSETAFQLLIALLLGAMVGVQRGWVSREQEAGARVAGIRTYSLTALTGGIAALLSQQLTFWFMPAMLLVVAALALTGYRLQAEATRNYSITGIVGLLLTFCFGAMAVSGEAVIAAMAAVITTMILDNKVGIHGALRKLQQNELDAALKLLLISVVMLPLLPQTGMGPGGVINLYAIWWMVVLIASISFIGYFSVRIAGARKGLLFTSLFAGLSSSTALTLHFSRLARSSPADSALLSAGILLACGTMFPRILLYCLLINHELVSVLLVPVVLMTLMLYLPAIVISLKQGKTEVTHPELAKNPLELQSALILGGMLVVILVLAEWLRQELGDTGVYLLAAVSGITDVDAISLSLSRMSVAETLSLPAAATGILIAVTVNNVFKSILALVIGRMALGIRVAGAMAGSLLVGFASLWLVM
ncbi:MgtC/SapB family protein [Oceanobacter mangrovi]|uniref:MgtC/SapB family protein n=1 Tax=Oceanobacter mangrovi TaxID=2862510 RepID=UPI001C8D993A|nr:MgtC/SapB family protein [Oceanobacter mangrovi]